MRLVARALLVLSLTLLLGACSDDAPVAEPSPTASAPRDGAAGWAQPSDLAWAEP